MPIGPKKIGKSFTAANIELPPHFFLNRPAKGFKGQHFLEAGLEAGVREARARLNELFSDRLSKLIGSNIRGVPSVTAPRAGIKVVVINQIERLREINIHNLLVQAFRDSEVVAKGVADASFNPKTHDQPLTQADRYRNTEQLFDYRQFSTSRIVGLRVRFTGNDFEIGKTFALNFGLRTAQSGELPGFGFSGGDLEDDG